MKSKRTRRRGESNFGTPPRLDAILKRLSFNDASGISGPVGHDFGFAECRHPRRSSSVLLLKGKRNKATVFSGVVTVDIVPLNGQSIFVPVSHSPLSERAIRTLPERVNLDTPSSVVGESISLWIQAPRLYATPERVQTRSAPSVRGVLFGNHLAAKASARRRIPAGDVLPRTFNNGSADTLSGRPDDAMPMTVRLVNQRIKNGQTPEHIATADLSFHSRIIRRIGVAKPRTA